MNNISHNDPQQCTLSQPSQKRSTLMNEQNLNMRDSDNLSKKEPVDHLTINVEQQRQNNQQDKKDALNCETNLQTNSGKAQNPLINITLQINKQNNALNGLENQMQDLKIQNTQTEFQNKIKKISIQDVENQHSKQNEKQNIQLIKAGSLQHNRQIKEMNQSSNNYIVNNQNADEKENIQIYKEYDQDMSNIIIQQQNIQQQENNINQNNQIINLNEDQDKYDNPSQLIEDQNYFNLIDNKKLEEICQKVNFVRNSLCKHFGKLRRDGRIIENDSLLGINIQLTEKQKKQRDHLILSLRRRSQIFLILNSIWMIIVALTYIEAQNWFKLNTLDTLSLDLLDTANGFTILELALWGISIVIGLCGITNFSITCLNIYQIGILITIIFEFFVNIILLNFVPISLAKSLVLMIFHFFFIFAGKIVQNAMLAFRSKYIPILYHCQMSYQSENNINKIISEQEGQMASSQIMNNCNENNSIQIQGDNPCSQMQTVRKLQSNNQQDIENKKYHQKQTQSEFQQHQTQTSKQQTIQESKQVQLLNNMQVQNKQKLLPNINTQDKIFNQKVAAQKQEDKNQIQSVVELDRKGSLNICIKQDISSFPAYEKKETKLQQDYDLQSENQQVIFNKDAIIYNPNVNINIQEFKKQSSEVQKLQRKETIISSIAQESQTTLPSNNLNYRNQNNPSQILPNLEEIELNVVTL